MLASVRVDSGPTHRSSARRAVPGDEGAQRRVGDPVATFRRRARPLPAPFPTPPARSSGEPATDSHGRSAARHGPSDHPSDAECVRCSALPDANSPGKRKKLPAGNTEAPPTSCSLEPAPCLPMPPRTTQSSVTPTDLAKDSSGSLLRKTHRPSPRRQPAR